MRLAYILGQAVYKLCKLGEVRRIRFEGYDAIECILAFIEKKFPKVSPVECAAIDEHFILGEAEEVVSKIDRAGNRSRAVSEISQESEPQLSKVFAARYVIRHKIESLSNALRL